MNSDFLMRELNNACAAAVDMAQESAFQSFDRAFTVGIGDEVARGNVNLIRNPTTQVYHAVITITVEHRGYQQQASSPSVSEAVEVAHKEMASQFDGPRPAVRNFNEEMPRVPKGMAQQGYVGVQREGQ